MPLGGGGGVGKTTYAVSPATFLAWLWWGVGGEGPQKMTQVRHLHRGLIEC